MPAAHLAPPRAVRFRLDMIRSAQFRAGRRWCFMVALDHRASFDRDLRGLGITATPSRRAALKTLVWEGIKEALPDVPASGDVAVLLERGLDGIVAGAADAGVTVALALEASGGDVLRPDAAPGELVRELRAIPGQMAKVLVRWHPKDGASRRERQLATLHALAEVTERSGRPLLLELLVPPTPDDRAALAGGERWDESRLPRYQAEVVATLVDSGLAPGAWKLEGHPDKAAARQVAEVIVGADPASYVLVLGGGAVVADLTRPFSGGAGIDAYKGFAVGRSIWRRAVIDLCRRDITEDAARRAVGRNFLAVIGTFEAAMAPTA